MKEEYCYPVFAVADDARIVERILSQDESALTEIINVFGHLLKKLIRDIVWNEHDTEEVFYDVLNSVWKRIDSFQVGKGRLIGWIVGIAKNKSIDRVRLKTNYIRKLERFRFEPDFMLQDPCIESCHDLPRIMNDPRIPEEQREVLFLHWINGLSDQEIATRLGIPLGTCKARLRRGFAKLKEVALLPGGLVREG